MKQGTQSDIPGSAPSCSPRSGPCTYNAPDVILFVDKDCPEHGVVVRLERERANVLAQIQHRQERLDAIDASLVLARARQATTAQRAAEVAGEDVGDVPGLVLGKDARR